MPYKNANPIANVRSQQPGFFRTVSIMGLILWLMLPAPAHAQYNYTNNSGKITITQYTGSGGAVTIPGTINSLPVTSIGNAAFYNCAKLTNITIPNSVTSIGYSAFSGCTSLASVTIPNSVTNIGNYGFNRCASLVSITVGKNVKSIGDGAFSDCTSLAAITVDSMNPNYCSLDGVLFNQSQTTLIQRPGGKVGNFTIPNSVQSIGNSAFSGCTNLASIAIPDSVTNIGNYGFDSCTSLVSITIGNNVKSIGDSAFIGCTSLTNIIIPKSVTHIGDEAFSECTSLANIMIGNSVTSIGLFAFFGCTELTSATIGNSVTSIGTQAFRYCDSLKGIYFKGNAPSLGSSVFSGDDKATVYYLAGTKGWTATFGGLPTAVWSLPMEISVTNFAIQTNGFGFKVTSTGTQPVVVDACASLTGPIWIPLRTNTPSEGSFIFNDSQWTDYPGRFYRVRSQ